MSHLENALRTIEIEIKALDAAKKISASPFRTSSR
jgi:hypothetical protein